MEDFADLPVRAITRKTVKDLHRKISETPGERARHEKLDGRGRTFLANHVMRLGSAIWNHADTEMEIADLPSNPFRKTAINAEPVRACNLNESSVAALFDEIVAIPNVVRRCMWMTMLFTGLRRNNVCHMKVEHVGAREAAFIDILKAKGFKPGMGKPLPYTPITEPLAFVLNEAEKAADPTKSEEKCMPWVFPSLHSARGSIRETKRLKLASPHDLRHLYRLMINSSKIHSDDGHALLFHSSGGGVHGGYLDLWAARHEVAKSAEVVAAHIERHLPKDWRQRLG
jgi:hypothetical protein